MMEALKVMTYFKISLSTHNWDSAFEKGSSDFFIRDKNTPITSKTTPP
ncbi:hypothetical protein AEBE7430_11285 [Aeromonas bestiarum]